MHNKKLVLENGKEFTGIGFGSEREVIGEIVFNTSMVGYQEILSDKSYYGQMVVMTYPLIGNYGLNDEDYETKIPQMFGFIVREYNDEPSNFRYTNTFGEILEEYDIPGISDIDTRELARIIRTFGSMKAMICDIEKTLDEALLEINNYETPTNQVEMVSTKKVWNSKTRNSKYKVVAIDCGIKYNIIRKFNDIGCNVTIVPYNTSAKDILMYQPDGIFISNGPGDPESVTEVIETIQTLQGQIPIFGICLGHQMISLANGASTYKLKFGHRGGNHPVKRIETGKIEITSQNHSYAVSEESLAGTGLELTHVNLLDNTIEGVAKDSDYIFSVQYHPESAPGPEDSEYLFSVFIDYIKKYKEVNKNA